LPASSSCPQRRFALTPVPGASGRCSSSSGRNSSNMSPAYASPPIPKICASIALREALPGDHPLDRRYSDRLAPIACRARSASSAPRRDGCVTRRPPRAPPQRARAAPTRSIAPTAALLVETLEREREQARRDLLVTLNGDWYRALLGRLRLPPRLAPGIEAIPLAKVARKEFRRLGNRVRRLGSHPDEAALHALRIALKRARYAAEFSAPPGKRGERFSTTPRRCRISSASSRTRGGAKAPESRDRGRFADRGRLRRRPNRRAAKRLWNDGQQAAARCLEAAAPQRADLY